MPANSAAPVSSAKQFIDLQSVTSSRSLGNGIEIRSGDAIMQITALRNDVLRIRVGPQGRLPEDASWAVLPSARTSSVQTVPEIGDSHIGFHTASLRVTCDATLRLTISDLAGKILQQDARSIEWNGRGFHIYKQKFGDSHFFGRGMVECNATAQKNPTFDPETSA